MDLGDWIQRKIVAIKKNRKQDVDSAMTAAATSSVRNFKSPVIR